MAIDATAHPHAAGTSPDVPLTYNRAATAAVQGRRLLEKARQELLLALGILRRLEVEPVGRANAKVSGLLAGVEALLARLEETGEDGGR